MSAGDDGAPPASAPRRGGNPRGGPGRRKGSPNKFNVINFSLARMGGATPLEFLLAAMRNPKLPAVMRLDAAKAAAPYVHPRLAHIVAHVTPDSKGLAPWTDTADPVRAENAYLELIGVRPGAIYDVVADGDAPNNST